ncbi:uncharacterized protein LOC125141181 isoform X1 [Tachysurus ichikawai]
MPRRISPLTDAIYYVTTKSDKTSKLEVKYISSEKGRGIFTLTSFGKGKFVAEYRGEMIDFIESQRRRRIYHDACGVFMFDLEWRGKTWCIDAAKEDGSFGTVMEDNPAENNVQEKQQPLQSTSLLDHNTATIASVTEQQSSSEDSDEQDMCIPSLRRTKSVFMKDLIPDASDELFDFTPDSGEEYVRLQR